MPRYSLFKLTGAIQHYDWGGTDFLPNLLGIRNNSNQPYAELWMGAHRRGPARVFINNNSVGLDELIEKDPEAVLGADIIQTFGPRLPYLFKVLDVNKMLSIQAHPTKRAAEEGFRRENQAGIPLKAPHRNYKDDNHKPEVMVALTDFWLLHGFQSKEAIAQNLEKEEAFVALRPHFKTGQIAELYKVIMQMPEQEVERTLRPLKQRLQEQWSKGILSKYQPDYWAAVAFSNQDESARRYDRGIFSIYLFNLVHLKKGQGIYQAPGIPHAYLSGQNIELMANSDNVFRGGLTNKHIDVAELLQHLRFDPVIPRILQGDSVSATEIAYATPAPDFLLSQVRISAEHTHAEPPAAGPHTWIVIEGEVTFNYQKSSFKIGKGESCFAAAGSSYRITTTGENALLYKASVPVSY